MRDVLIQSSTRVIIALGAAFIILTGGADLSSGRVVGISAVISASMLQGADYARKFYPNLPELPLIVPILVAILVGVLVGALNGYIVSKFKVPAFIATLGTMVIVYGANSIYFNLPPNNSQPIGGLREDFSKLGTGSFLGVPYVILIAIAVILVIYVILNKTKLGKNLYAIGGNEEAAVVSGINVKKNLMALYVIAGTLYGIAGVLEAARTGGATNNYGTGYELDAIAACVVGGWSVSGGVGTVPGVVVGVLIFSVINYGLTFVGVNPYWQQIIKGAIIVTAVAFDIRKYLTKK
jgi:methyl-galactoside transport system permease protein